jgi:hypothetical protein
VQVVVAAAAAGAGAALSVEVVKKFRGPPSAINNH